MRNSNTLVKMLGFFMSIFIYILSCLGAFISPGDRNFTNSTVVDSSMPKHISHIQHDKKFNATPLLSYNTSYGINANHFVSSNKMTFQNEIPISNHTEIKRLIVEPSESSSKVQEIFVTIRKIMSNSK